MPEDSIFENPTMAHISSDTAMTVRELALKVTERAFFFPLSLKLELEMELKSKQHIQYTFL